jgi:site-specific recombinase XerD
MITPDSSTNPALEEIDLEAYLLQWLEDLADQGKARETIRRYRSAASAFLDWLGKRRPSQRLLNDYVDYLQIERGMRPRTIHTIFAALSSFRDYLAANGVVNLPEVRAVKLPRLDKADRATPTVEEVQLMFDVAHLCGSHAASPSYREYLRGRALALLSIACLCGLRRDEIFHVELEDLKHDHHGRQLYVRRAKGRESRTVPMNARCWGHINAWLKIRAERLKMHGNTTQTALLIDDRGRRMGSRSAEAILREVFAFAHLEGMGFTMHSLRHGFATLMLQAGVDIKTLQMLLGHSDLRTTYLYTHTDHKTMRSAVERLDGILAPVSRQVPVLKHEGRRRQPMQTRESQRRMVRRSARE